MLILKTSFSMPPQWLHLLRMTKPNFSLPMDEIGRRVETSVIQNYNQQRSPSGIPWIPSKRAIADGGKTLIDTGRMLASLVVAYDKTTATVGYPDGDIPRWLHFGVPQNHLPAREHLGLRPEDDHIIAGILADYFDKMLQ